MGRRTVRLAATRHTTHGTLDRLDTVAVEEPLVVMVDGARQFMTLRSPGDDMDLALGWLHAEGIVTSAADVARMTVCSDAQDAGGSPTYNVVDVRCAPGVVVPDHTRRTGYVAASCGICGSDAVDALTRSGRHDVTRDETRVPLSTLHGMVDRMRTAQKVFERTGGVHAAALFAADGELTVVREDIGRHNAVDKVVGWALRAGTVPLSGHVLVLSGRLGFELVQKAGMAGVPIVASVSAPSSLAVAAAERVGMTLAGFLRPPATTVYTHPRRLTGA